MPNPRRKIKPQFAPHYSLDNQVCIAAAKAVVLGSESVDDAKMLLDMLGLIEPQPGYEPASREENKAQIKLENKRYNRLMNKMNPTPEEIGEPEDEDETDSHYVVGNEHVS